MLIILSVVCAVLILSAGAIQLFMIR